VLGCGRQIGNADPAMRALFFLILCWLAATRAVWADEQLIERFDGHNSLTTSDFNVPNHWEIRWHSDQALSIGIIRLDNTVVAGASGMTSGSLYLPRGGTFRLRVKGEDPIPWDIAVVSLGPAPTAPAATANGAETGFYAPTVGPEETASTNGEAEEAVPPAPEPTASPTPTPTPTPLPTQLSPAQQHALVTVKGDRAQGTGFLLETSSGPVVVTTFHLIANNPNLALLSADGTELKMTTLRGATDRDLVMIGVEDKADAPLEAATDMGNEVQPGDAVLTSASGTDPSSTGVTQVKALLPASLDLGDFPDHGDVGGPVIEARSGKVIAVVDAIPRVAASTDLDKAPFATRDAASAHSMSYFGLRLDTAAGWETYDPNRLALETAFLDAFHQRSRCLDSYLNGRNKDNRPLAKFYQNDDKIKTAIGNFVQRSAGGDASQVNESLRSLLFELGTVADIDLDQIQQPANFYTFDQQRAQDEIAYRQAIKTEIDFYGNNLNRFAVVARRNN
jgi:hypothetical protein